MTRRLRSLPLGVWLALGFALAVAAPTLSAGVTWWAVGARQQADVEHRLTGAIALVDQADGDLDDAGARRTLLRGLANLQVEADLNSSPPKEVGMASRATPSHRPMLRSSSRRGWREARIVPPTGSSRRGSRPRWSVPAGSARSRRHYAMHPVESATTMGTLFVERPSRAVRLAATSGAGLLALALAVIAGVILLRRWVVTPLARLAADAERIAGGELDVAPVNSRTREVAEVGAALRGMADGLRGALAEQHAAETAAPLPALRDRPRPADAAVHPARVAARRSSTASATPTTCAARATRRRCWTGSSAISSPSAGSSTPSPSWRATRSTP